MGFIVQNLKFRNLEFKFLDKIKIKNLYNGYGNETTIPLRDDGIINVFILKIIFILFIIYSTTISKNIRK